jgi:2-hydroxy-3-oxopropionate reductase
MISGQIHKVAFIGLGIMGQPMAVNLVRANFAVVGYNRSQPSIDHLINAGGRGAASLAEAASDADAVITMLPDTPDVAEVVLGQGGVLEVANPGTLLIDMSTINPSMAVEIARRGSAAGLRTLDAPVSGGQQGAIDGTLSIMVGGDAADLVRARPVLEAMGSTVVHVGPSGCGQLVKAANQLIVAGIIEVVAEALVFLEAQHVDTASAIEVLNGGLAGNQILARKAKTMLGRQFQPGFRTTLHHKDLQILLTAAREAGVVLPLGAVVSQLMASLVAQGFGDLDHSALFALVSHLSGGDDAFYELDTEDVQIS